MDKKRHQEICGLGAERTDFPRGAESQQYGITETEMVDAGADSSTTKSVVCRRDAAAQAADRTDQ